MRIGFIVSNNSVNMILTELQKTFEANTNDIFSVDLTGVLPLASKILEKRDTVKNSDRDQCL